jgi:neutral/alkaline ceramidase-like enzyme
MPNETMLEAGEGVADITPPLGIELAGFHRQPGKERRVTGIRQPAHARALVLRHGRTVAAIAVLDVCGVPRDFVQRVQKRASKLTRIPSENIRVCVTHTHSMPTLRFFRQWGAVSKEYSALVEQRAVQAIVAAKEDLARADCYLGKERVTGGNHNRTTKTWKTNEAFTKEATDDERWLDTLLHALLFLREKPKRSLLWYQFSAHPVCYTDGNAGPDWPGLVAEKMKAWDDLSPAFLQGDCGDVNPGPGNPSLGDPEKVSDAVYAALHHATNHSSLVEVDAIRTATTAIKLPLNIARLKDQLERYRKDPSQCTKGEWVDAGFAKDWFDSASKWKTSQDQLRTPMTAMRLGDLGLLFHSAELYSFYGLVIRRDSPFANTLVVGYADDFIGYVTDPTAHKNNEYAAVVVPKLLGLPSFQPEAGRQFAAEALKLLGKVA